MTSVTETDVSHLIVDELSCCVCCELFREPKILSCAHTICADCLGNMVEYTIAQDGDIFALHRPRMKQVVRCPICRHFTDVPDNGIEGFSTNYLVKRLVELHSGLGEVRDIRRKIAESKGLLEQVQNSVASIDEIMKMVEERKQAVVLDINQVFDSIIEKLRERQEELVESCSNKAATRLRELRDQKQRTRAVESIMKETIDRVELSMGSVDVLQRKEAITDELRQLEMFLVFNEPKELSDFKLVVERDQEIMDRISELGHIQSAFDVPGASTPVAVSCNHKAKSVNVIKVINNYSDGDDNQSALTLPWGVTITSNDVVVVADHANNCILQFDQGGNFLRCYTQDHNLCLPTGVAVSDEGKILVLDSGNHCIKELNSSGDLVRVIGKDGSGSDGIGERAEGLTVDHEGRLIVADTDNDRVQVFHGNGRLAMKFGDTGKHRLNHPSCAVYHRGKFVVSDTHNHCLKFYDRNGLFVRQVGLPGTESGQFRHPRGLTVDGNSNILVCDSGNCRIQVLDLNGNFITSFGTMGDEEGQFCFPYAIAINSQGAVVVTDCNNNRVQILRFQD